MDYVIKPLADGVLVNLSGRLTLVDHEKFRAVVDTLTAVAGSRWVFDLAGLDFLDSSGLGMFLVARETAHERNIGIELTGARENVLRILQIARFDSLFKIVA